MKALALLEKAKEVGLRLRADGDALEVEGIPGPGVDAIIEELRQNKGEVLSLLQGQANVLPKGYRLKYPEAQATKQELEEIADRVEVEGYVLLWSTVLNDFVAFYKTEEDRKRIPPGFVPYSDVELWELFGDGKPQPSRQTLKLIHEVKKLGGRVVDNEPYSESPVP